MPVYKKKEFADLTGQTTKLISTYQLRGKVVYDENSNIDTTNPINAAFLQKYGNANKVAPTAPAPQMPRSETWVDPAAEKTDEFYEIMKGILPYDKSEQLLKHRDAEKRELEKEKLTLEIAKKKGEVIPYEVIIPLFLQHNQSFVTSFNNVCQAILTEYGKVKDFSTDEFAAMRGRILGEINRGLKQAHEMTEKAVKVIVRDYSDKKGVGQRD